MMVVVVATIPIAAWQDPPAQEVEANLVEGRVRRLVFAHGPKAIVSGDVLAPFLLELPSVTRGPVNILPDRIQQAMTVSGLPNQMNVYVTNIENGNFGACLLTFEVFCQVGEESKAEELLKHVVDQLSRRLSLLAEFDARIPSESRKMLADASQAKYAELLVLEEKRSKLLAQDIAAGSLPFDKVLDLARGVKSLLLEVELELAGLQVRKERIQRRIAAAASADSGAEVIVQETAEIEKVAADLRGEVASLAAKYGQSHPEVKRVKTKLAEFERQIEEHTRRVWGLAGIELAKELEEVLTADAVASRKFVVLKEQLRRLDEASAAGKELSRIERQIEQAESAIQRLQQEIDLLEETPRIQVDVRILHPPTPREPAKTEESQPK